MAVGDVEASEKKIRSSYNIAGYLNLRLQKKTLVAKIMHRVYFHTASSANADVYLMFRCPSLSKFEPEMPSLGFKRVPQQSQF
jgi:hypothetical protein